MSEDIEATLSKLPATPAITYRVRPDQSLEI